MLSFIYSDMDAPRYILDKPIPEDIQRFLQRPLQPERPCVDLDDKVPHNVAYPMMIGLTLFILPKMSLK